ncbi:CPBP family intramembrane glutamic endopeptidase [Sporosarcina highlanderae]|uniref:CPBP family intramembrane metalloprotease n=1 Tax=Sporosarcina highlanderae TaxID=3035916 RepID=A0ABT8JMC6_9BACL|nr:CPBP family intramembrane glutamic endopeptidase [Sporosarcina highlanderae]MDN4606225.1 CPBP family intramembrane metalloprotease [Sporosarcina highlanderae]
MFKNEANQVRAGWLIFLGFAAMFIMQQIFALPGGVLLALVDFPFQDGNYMIDINEAFARHPWIFLLTQGGGTVGGMLATVLVWKFVNKGTLRELGFRGSLKDLWYGLFLGAASIFVIFVILLASGNIEMMNSFGNPEFTVYTLSYLFLFILVGFFEEMFFRGYVMSTMQSRGNRKWVIYVVSAVIFSLVHGTNPNVSVLGLVNIALVGILFAYMFDATNSLWLPIGYHITWNYFQGNVFGFAVSGTAPYGIYNVSVENGNAFLTGGAFGLEGGLLATLLIVLGFFATRVYVRMKAE